MRTPAVASVMGLLLVLVLIGQAGSTESVDGGEKNDICEDPCKVYLAPSTIPNAGLGIFTSREIQPGEIIGQPDVGIPIVDHSFHNGSPRDPYLDNQVNFENLTVWHVDVFDDYVWAGEATGITHEGDDKDTRLYAPGLDAAINCNLALINVDHNTPQILTDTSFWPHRAISPGAGAMSPYYNGTTTSQTYIPPGAELFKDYGSAWFDTRPHLFEMTPLVADYAKAERTVRNFVSKTRRGDNDDGGTITKTSTTFPEAIAEPLYDLIYNFGYKSRLINALPKYDEIDLVLKEGIGAIHQPSAVRSNLRTMPEARCISHIERRPSLLPHAGNGAFALTSFKEGDIISGSPLLHIPHRDVFNMYSQYTDERGYGWRNKSDLLSQQLIVNYCWSHPDTTVMLCPYGGGINYINHNRSLANVKLQWAPHDQISMNQRWLKMTPMQMGDHKSWSPCLAFDYVATRAIEEGEELYIDYGQLWEDAWQRHVQNWRPSGPKDYEPAAAINQRVHSGKDVFRTKDELPPYGDHLMLRCHASLRYKLIIASRPGSGDHSTTGDMTWRINEGQPCEILERKTGGGKTTYRVNMTEARGTHVVEDNVPANLIAFRDRKYTSDIHLPNAFRHYAVIPDHLLPEAWRNVVTEEETRPSTDLKHDEL